MAKARKIYVCTNCGADSSKWIGRCPSCGQWNTYKEEIIAKTGGRNEILSNSVSDNKPKLLSEIDIVNHPRIISGITEFDRILGGGVIPGSLILLGGEPGIGKSTIALQIALQQKQKVLYNSGEESQQQIKLRAERLKHSSEQCYILNEQNLEKIILSAKELNPELMVIDSVQTLFTSHIEATTGTISQIRECTHQLMNYAKATNIPVIIIGHITKDGTLAGPKILEHMVDVVLLFEGDSHLNYRIIRSIKNRFGAVPELAVFEMKQSGLTEIKNPSLLFFDFEKEDRSGVTAACNLDGIRPLFIEIQVLVSQPVYATPQRNSTGFDSKRLNMLLAVIEKKAGIKILMKDVFLNVAGGFKIQDPAADLSIIMALISSFLNIPLDNSTCFCAEVSLTGDLKVVNKLNQRIDEAEKLGFKTIIISDNKENFKDRSGKISILSFKTVTDIIRNYFSSKN